MRERCAKLIDVKSIVTLGIVAAFVYLSITKTVDAENFMQVVLVIITFYFAKQNRPPEPEGDIVYVEMPLDPDA